MANDPEKTAIVRLDTLLKSDDDHREAFLTVLGGVERGRAHRLPYGSTLIGRSRKADLFLDDEGISRNHAEVILHSDGRAEVRDCGSTNGTWLGTERLTDAPRPLAEGDKIRLSTEVVLRFDLQDRIEQGVLQHLYDAAVRDGLTGAYNQRHFAERLEQEHAWALRSHAPLSLILLDLDHFKLVNDTYGHDAGDAVLRTLAQRIDRHLRKGEIFARYGGEEFVVLMRDTPLDAAVKAAERLRLLIESEPVTFGGNKIAVTVSIGVASTSKSGPETAHGLFARADHQLYKAKRAGRNRVAHSS